METHSFRFWGRCWRRVGISGANIGAGSRHRQGTWALPDLSQTSPPTPLTLSLLLIWLLILTGTLILTVLPIAQVICPILPFLLFYPTRTPCHNLHKFLIIILASLTLVSFSLFPYATSTSRYFTQNPLSCHS